MTEQPNLADINQTLKQQSPESIIQWALEQQQKTIVTTNFGPHEAAILHMVSQHCPDIPVVCIDHGYNTEATYRFAEELTQRLLLNMHYYTPKVTAKRRMVVYDGFPGIDDEQAHDVFTREVKLEPFHRAMLELKPDIWLTAIRKDQTAFRGSLDIVTKDSNIGALKVAPLFYWSESEVEDYLKKHDLPIERDYFDPTKVLTHRECGLHLGKT
ncbi:phosphoadenylylsulfate reductase [Candidatus Endobugula sertula]|uniref:Phosphoadenylylsulfate reductase n=1 Tax=Candidatus Endobugula sertula TaxID=62101 RepID=A0A1D2QRA8_9GAMM|nr:phosphoadenylylsulfate reductase [Candidatus Endobugula sertula]